MGIFSKKKDKMTTAQLRQFHGKRLSYVVERINGDELGLGKHGGISVSDDEIIVVCDGHEVMRAIQKGAVMAELMSHNGVDIKAVDSASGKLRHIVAYYSNIRQ